jgi:protein-disulfide isomerase
MSKNQIYVIVGAGCLLAVCAVAALAAGIFFFMPLYSSRTIVPMDNMVQVASIPRPAANGNSMGDPSAPIQMVEYSDFQCPFCERFATETEPLLVENYIETGKVYFTYRSTGNWVSRNMGQGSTESQDAALAAYCAGDQNKFWEMHDSLYANNRDVEDQGAFTEGRLKAMAESIDLVINAFNKCYDSGQYTGQVQQDYTDALAANVQGTPSFVITFQVNGETQTMLIEGAQPYTVFQQTLDSILIEIDQ